VKNTLRTVALLVLVSFCLMAGAIAASGRAAALPQLTARAVITKITTGIGIDPGKPMVAVEATVVDDGVITGGTVTITTVGSSAAAQFAPGANVKLVLGGK